MDREQRADAALLRQDTLACLGRVAAGIAHEMHRPMGSVHSNLGTLRRYVGKLAELVEACHDRLGADPELEALRERLKIGYVLQDLPALVEECMEGADRVRRMLGALEAFAPVPAEDPQYADLNEGLRSALNLLGPAVRGHALVRTDLGDVPPVRCLPGAVNRALLSLLVEAAEGIERHGELRVATRTDASDALVEIAATGVPAGRPGDGAGLRLSREVVARHGGTLAVDGSGDTRRYRLRLPLRGEAMAAPAA